MGRDAGVATPNHQSAEGPATPTNFPAVEGSSDTPTSSRRQELVEAGSGGGGCCVSVYRESLFVTLVALGQDNIDLTAFDRSVSALCGSSETNHCDPTISVAEPAGAGTF